MFYCLVLKDFKPFKKQIKEIKRKGFSIIILRKNIFGKYSYNAVLRRFSGPFVLPKNFNENMFYSYPTEEFKNSMILSFLKGVNTSSPIIKNQDGKHLNLLLNTINNCNNVYIKTNNKNEFYKLCEDSMTLYGTEPTLLEENAILSNENLIDIDGFLEKLNSPLILSDPLFKDLDPLQLKAAFNEM